MASPRLRLMSSPAGSTDAEPDHLEVLSRALELLADDQEAASDVAAELRASVPRRRRRRPFTPETMVAVFRRDRFTCRYCGAAVVPPPVLRAASLVWPDLIPYHPNWRADATHPLYVSRSATVAYVEPHANGGSHDEPENLATACRPCSTRKADLPGWSMIGVPVTEWDGLVRHYPTLWKVGEPRATPADAAYHRRWLQAFGSSTLSTEEGGKR